MPKESDMQNRFGRWLKYNWDKPSVFELKITKTQSLPFKEVKDHQVLALDMAQNRHLYYKIPDDTFGRKPFDCFFLTKITAYVVIMFYTRGQSRFIMINIDDWKSEIEMSDRKSITEKRAMEIGRTYHFG